MADDVKEGGNGENFLDFSPKIPPHNDVRLGVIFRGVARCIIIVDNGCFFNFAPKKYPLKRCNIRGKAI